MRFDRSAAAVFLIAIALRLLVYLIAPELRTPSYPDAAYYSAVAASVIEGAGFTVPYVWAFVDVGGLIPTEPTLPVPAFAHWAPLAVLVQLPFVALFGVGGIAAYIPFYVASGLFAVLCMHIARRAGLSDRARLIVGLLVAGGSGVGVFFTQIDNYALFGVCLTLWVIALDRLRHQPSWQRAAIAGATAGVAMLCRTDGLLLIVAGTLLLLVQARARIFRPALFAYLLGAVAILLPFWLRQLTVFGSISPSAASGRILYIRTYEELFSAAGPLGIDHLLSWGPSALLESRLAAIGVVASQLGLIVAGVVALPFALLGLRRVVARPVLQPYLLWLILHTIWSVLVAAPHLPTGNYLHSAAAALGLIAIAAMFGVEVAAPRLSALTGRLARSDHERTTRRWQVGLLFGTSMVALVTTVSLLASWEPRVRARNEVSVYLRANAAPGDRAMSADPGGWWWRSGLPGVATPDDEYTLIGQAIEAYGIDWVIVDRGETVPALLPLLKGRPIAGLTGPCAYATQGNRIESALYRVGTSCR